MSADGVLFENGPLTLTADQGSIPGALDEDLGMNLISANFDIVVVNRANERLYGKPMVEFLGKKCYSEFEKRDSICPHCPGAEALRTGEPCTKEAEGIRDDGSRFIVLCTAYPVLGPDNKPVGFIEVERDITGRRGDENTGAVLNNLRHALTNADDCSWALRYTLDAALSLDGVESGCTYLIKVEGGEMTMVSMRGPIAACIESVDLRDVVQGPTVAVRPLSIHSRGDDGQDSAQARWLATLRIKAGPHVVALLFLGLAMPAISPSTQLAFEALTEVATTAIVRITADHSRREQRARLRHVLQNLPVPVMCFDKDARITMCNRVAERALGYHAGQSLEEESLLLNDEDIATVKRLLLSGGEFVESRGVQMRTGDGRTVDMQVLIASFADEVDDASRLVLIGQAAR